MTLLQNLQKCHCFVVYYKLMLLMQFFVFMLRNNLVAVRIVLPRILVHALCSTNNFVHLLLQWLNSFSPLNLIDTVCKRERGYPCLGDISFCEDWNVSLCVHIMTISPFEESGNNTKYKCKGVDGRNGWKKAKHRKCFLQVWLVWMSHCALGVWRRVITFTEEAGEGLFLNFVHLFWSLLPIIMTKSHPRGNIWYLMWTCHTHTFKAGPHLFWTALC